MTITNINNNVFASTDALQPGRANRRVNKDILPSVEALQPGKRDRMFTRISSFKTIDDVSIPKSNLPGFGDTLLTDRPGSFIFNEPSGMEDWNLRRKTECQREMLEPFVNYALGKRSHGDGYVQIRSLFVTNDVYRNIHELRPRDRIASGLVSSLEGRVEDPTMVAMSLAGLINGWAIERVIHSNLNEEELQRAEFLHERGLEVAHILAEELFDNPHEAEEFLRLIRKLAENSHRFVRGETQSIEGIFAWHNLEGYVNREKVYTDVIVEDEYIEAYSLNIHLAALHEIEKTKLLLQTDSSQREEDEQEEKVLFNPPDRIVDNNQWSAEKEEALTTTSADV